MPFFKNHGIINTNKIVFHNEACRRRTTSLNYFVKGAVTVYKLTVRGETRRAEFELDVEKKTFCRTMLEVKEGLEKEKTDLLYVNIRDTETRSNLDDIWMVLNGTAKKIVEDIVEVYPMAKLETDAIFGYIDTVNPEQELTIVYPIRKPPSPVIRRAPIHKTMRACQSDIVSAMFDIPKEKIKVLDIN